MYDTFSKRNNHDQEPDSTDVSRVLPPSACHLQGGVEVLLKTVKRAYSLWNSEKYREARHLRESTLRDGLVFGGGGIRTPVLMCHPMTPTSLVGGFVLEEQVQPPTSIRLFQPT